MPLDPRAVPALSHSAVLTPERELALSHTSCMFYAASSAYQLATRTHTQVSTVSEYSALTINYHIAPPLVPDGVGAQCLSGTPRRTHRGTTSLFASWSLAHRRVH